MWLAELRVAQLKNSLFSLYHEELSYEGTKIFEVKPSNKQGTAIMDHTITLIMTLYLHR
jgi:hypothetical protein